MITADVSPAFKGLADPTRRALLDRLGEGERTVSELCEGFAMSQPAISQHLKVLRECGLVTVRKDGRRRLYALEAGPLKEAYVWIGRYERFWDDGLERLGQLLDEMPASPPSPDSPTDPSA